MIRKKPANALRIKNFKVEMDQDEPSKVQSNLVSRLYLNTTIIWHFIHFELFGT